MRTYSTVALALLALTTCGCKNKNASAEGGAPSASVVVVPASASAAPAGTGPICGDATSTGKGTSSDPCKSKDPKFRAIEGKWTGKYSLSKAEFALTNKMPFELVSADASIYYYDKAGKQLTTKLKDGKVVNHSSQSGGILGSGIPKGETKNISMGWYEEKTAKTCDTCTPIPPGTTTIEIEVDRVWWKDARGTDDGYVYWENRALAPDNRPMGGVK